MINLPEIGYTPANYKVLVELTSLTDADFYNQFQIPRQTFKHHYDGTRTMRWQDWQQLLQQVNDFVKTNPL